MNRLYDITDDYILRRSNIKNYKNGRAKIGCIISSDAFDLFGINHYNIDSKFNSRHAEVDAVTKLRYTEKQKQITIIVFRTNNNGDKLMMAKPCEHCVLQIRRTLKFKNYKLKGNKCWYTDIDGNFSCIKI
jgi:cytidine deaminase